MNKPKIMVSLFDHSTVMAQPWANAGYTCFCYDLKHPRGESTVVTAGGTIVLVGRDILYDSIVYTLDMIEAADFIAAFPPCDDLAVSGARWFQQKGMRRLIAALSLVERARELCEDVGHAPFMIENPVSTLATYWRKPDYMFDPCDYAGYADDPQSEAHTKRTCLWTGNGFIMPEPKRVEPVGVRPGQPNAWYSKVGGKSEKTKAYRSQTAQGFARAVFLANHKE